MNIEPIYFNTTNEKKFVEISHLFQPGPRPLRQLSHSVVEILDTDLERVVRAKALAAYRAVQRAVLVEHGGVFIDHISDLPGVMLKYMWDGLGSRVCEILPRDGPRRAMVRTALCFCDGKRRYVEVGEVSGRIAELPRGASGLTWDTIFIPDNSEQTFAEMSLPDKMQSAPAAQAYRRLELVLRSR